MILETRLNRGRECSAESSHGLDDRSGKKWLLIAQKHLCCIGSARLDTCWVSTTKRSRCVAPSSWFTGARQTKDT